MSYPSSSNLFFRDLAEGVREAAAAHSVSVVARESGSSVEHQLADIQELLDEGIDALIVSPIDSAAVGDALGLAERRSVPVFTVDRAALNCPVVSHIASDNLLGGRLAGDLLARLIDYDGEVAVVGEIIGRSGRNDSTELWAGTSIAERIRGFSEAVAHHPGIQIVAEMSGMSDRRRSHDVTVDLLAAHPSLAGIFAANDVMALGVLDALRDRGQEERVVVVGYDATPQACAEILRGGALRGDVAQFPTRLGHTVVEVWANYVQGRAVPERVDIPVEMVTVENVQRFTGAERLLHVRRGEVWTAGERVVFFPVRGYQMMLNEIHDASPDLLRHIVYRSGFVLGESIAEQVREYYTDPRDWLFVLLEDLARGGFGRFELMALDLGRGTAEVHGYDLFEASIASELSWTRRRSDRATPRSTDNYCSGRLAGYLTAIFGRQTTCEEILCQGRGDPYCQFIMIADGSADVPFAPDAAQGGEAESP